MKIGILTFHWATNYGAVLQAYALQTYLESQGHDVKIVNYKPRLYDNNIVSFFILRKYKDVAAYKISLLKEKAIQEFRKNNLHLTKRAYRCSDLPSVTKEFDILISGSDQVLNPNFLRNGDFPRVVTPSYFLSFPFEGKKVGYAVSFGCSSYPDEDKDLASTYIKNFDKIGVRENTGIRICESLGFLDSVLVPDPTALLSSSFYEQIASESSFDCNREYNYCFILREVEKRKQQLNIPDAIWNQEDGLYGMSDWLKKIKFARLVVTDSFHCVMMCLKFHTPFIVVTESKGNTGMNDRLITLLDALGLGSQLRYIADINNIINMEVPVFRWNKIDQGLFELTNKAVDFLKI